MPHNDTASHRYVCEDAVSNRIYRQTHDHKTGTQTDVLLYVFERVALNFLSSEHIFHKRDMQIGKLDFYKTKIMWCYCKRSYLNQIRSLSVDCIYVRSRCCFSDASFRRKFSKEVSCGFNPIPSLRNILLKLEGIPRSLSFFCRNDWDYK